MTGADDDRQAIRRVVEEGIRAHQNKSPRVDEIWSQISKTFSGQEFTFTELCDLGITSEEANFALQTLKDMGRIETVGLRIFRIVEPRT